MIYVNTKKRGTARIISFPFGKGYRSVCLDFDLVEDAKTLEEVQKQIKESVIGYVRNIYKNNLSDELLNRHADKKYWKMFEEHQKFIDLKKVTSRSFSKNVRNSSLLSLPIRSLCLAR